MATLTPESKQTVESSLVCDCDYYGRTDRVLLRVRFYRNTPQDFKLSRIGLIDRRGDTFDLTANMNALSDQQLVSANRAVTVTCPVYEIQKSVFKHFDAQRGRYLRVFCDDDAGQRWTEHTPWWFPAQEDSSNLGFRAPNPYKSEKDRVQSKRVSIVANLMDGYDIGYRSDVIFLKARLTNLTAETVTISKIGLLNCSNMLEQSLSCSKEITGEYSQIPVSIPAGQQRDCLLTDKRNVNTTSPNQKDFTRAFCVDDAGFRYYDLSQWWVDSSGDSMSFWPLSTDNCSKLPGRLGGVTTYLKALLGRPPNTYFGLLERL